MKKNKEDEKPSPAPDYYKVTHLAASALRKSTESVAEPRPFECDVCGSCWSRNSALIRHMYVHTGEKPFRCSFCPRAFRSTSNLGVHEKLHRGDRPHACPNCPKTYILASELRRHMRVVHLHLKLYDCPDCSEKFYGPFEVRRHRIHHHGGERPFSCSQCDKKFIEGKSLRKHLYTAHGIMPYACSKCDRKFRLQNEMLCHEGTHQDDDNDFAETGKISTAKQTVKVPLGEPLQSSAKSQKNEKKVTSPIPGAKSQSSQQKENSGSKLIKQNKTSNSAMEEKSELESEEEISILYQSKQQTESWVETKQVEKSIKKLRLANESSPMSKIQPIVELEPTTDDQKEKSSSSSSSKKKFHCNCGKSYKSIEKFQRHQQRNEGHEDAKLVLQQPSTLTNDEELPKNKEPNSKKVKLQTVQDINENRENAKVKVENVKSEENPLEELAKKRNRVLIKTEPNNPSTVPESPPKKKRYKLTVPTNDEREGDEKTEMCQKSFKKKHHCICGKSYKSIEKFQRHQQRNGHDNDTKVEEGGKQQSPSSQNATSSSFQQFNSTNQEEEKYYHQVGAKSLMLEKVNKSKLKQVQKFNPDENANNKCKLKEIKREKAETKINLADTKVETTDLKVKTELPSFDDKCSKKKRSKKIKLEKVDYAAEFYYKEQENKVKPSAEHDFKVQQKKMKKEKADEKLIQNNRIKNEKVPQAIASKEINTIKNPSLKTESSTTTIGQLSTINRIEKKKTKRNEDIKEESQEDEIEIVEIKITKKQDEKFVEEKCSCGKLFSSPEKFQRHRERKGHHIPKNYKCFCSSQVFNNLEEFRSHMWENHTS